MHLYRYRFKARKAQKLKIEEKSFTKYEKYVQVNLKLKIVRRLYKNSSNSWRVAWKIINKESNYKKTIENIYPS